MRETYTYKNNGDHVAIFRQGEQFCVLPTVWFANGKHLDLVIGRLIEEFQVILPEPRKSVNAFDVYIENRNIENQAPI